jgi:hypothetical protein
MKPIPRERTIPKSQGTCRVCTRCGRSITFHENTYCVLVPPGRPILSPKAAVDLVGVAVPSPRNPVPGGARAFSYFLRGCRPPRSAARVLTLWTPSNEPGLPRAKGSSLPEIAVLSGPIRDRANRVTKSKGRPSCSPTATPSTSLVAVANPGRYTSVPGLLTPVRFQDVDRGPAQFERPSVRDRRAVRTDSSILEPRMAGRENTKERSARCS